MVHSGSRSAPAPLRAGVLAGARTTAQTSVLRYSAGPRATLSTEFLPRTGGLGTRRVGQRAIALCRLDDTAKRRSEPNRQCIQGAARPNRHGWTAVLAFVPCTTGREPTANGRAAQETVRAPQLRTTRETLRFPRDLFLALIAMHEASSVLETNDNLTCKDFGVQGSNVRHERRRKGREAAFGTSARWRG
jgi:hypothetical protein